MLSTSAAKTVSFPPFGNVCLPASVTVTELLVTLVTLNPIGLYTGTLVETLFLPTFVTTFLIFERTSTS